MRVAVVGGGIAGLSAAHRLLELDATLEVRVFEAGKRLGGSLASERVAGYLLEEGGDMFITDKTAALSLCQRLGIADRLVSPNEQHRGSLVLRNGKPEPVPQGFVLMAPTEIRSMVKTPILSPLGKLRMAAELFVPRGRANADESVASFVRRRFGSEALDRLVQPLIGGIYTGDPERLSLRATLPRFCDMEQNHRSLMFSSLRQPPRKESGARYGLFVSLPGGLGELVDALGRRVTELGAEVRVGSAVVRVARSASGFRLETSDGHSMEFDALIVALAAWQAAALVAPLSKPLSARLARIPYASTAVVASGYRLADVAHPLDAFGLVVPHREGRKVLAVSFASRKFEGRAPEGRVLFRTFVGGALQPELYTLDDQAMLQVVRGELEAMLGVAGTPEFERVLRHPRSMPQYEVGHLALVDAIEAELARLPRLALAGNAYRGVGIPDCVLSGERAAERLLGASA
jgi:oxygen-dependent protoporphyrinogen oxidase